MKPFFIIITTCFIICLLELLGKCNTSHSSLTINDIAYKKGKKEENCVYILENNCFVPFIVVTSNYNNGYTLLLRKNVLPQSMSISDYNSYYENSSIDKYLNSDYFNSIDDSISSLIHDVPISIASRETLGYSGTETTEIIRKVFLLSCTELGIEESVNMGKEGKSLPYFETVKNRIAYSNDKSTTWWLRSANTYYDSCTYYIGNNGVIGSTNAFTENGARPAFCVDNNAAICLNSDIIENTEVYTFENLL